MTTVSEATFSQPKTTRRSYFPSRGRRLRSLETVGLRLRRINSTTIYCSAVAALMSTGRGRKSAGVIVGVGSVIGTVPRRLWLIKMTCFILLEWCGVTCFLLFHRTVLIFVRISITTESV
jgi:hypothetical protein